MDVDLAKTIFTATVCVWSVIDCEKMIYVKKKPNHVEYQAIGFVIGTKGKGRRDNQNWVLWLVDYFW